MIKLIIINQPQKRRIKMILNKIIQTNSMALKEFRLFHLMLKRLATSTWRQRGMDSLLHSPTLTSPCKTQHRCHSKALWNQPVWSFNSNFNTQTIPPRMLTGSLERFLEFLLHASSSNHRLCTTSSNIWLNSMTTSNSSPTAWPLTIQNMYRSKYRERETRTLTESFRGSRLPPNMCQARVNTKAPLAVAWD